MKREGTTGGLARRALALAVAALTAWALLAALPGASFAADTQASVSVTLPQGSFEAGTTLTLEGSVSGAVLSSVDMSSGTYTGTVTVDDAETFTVQVAGLAIGWDWPQGGWLLAGYTDLAAFAPQDDQTSGGNNGFTYTPAQQDAYVFQVDGGASRSLALDSRVTQSGSISITSTKNGSDIGWGISPDPTDAQVWPAWLVASPQIGAGSETLTLSINDASLVQDERETLTLEQNESSEPLTIGVTARKIMSRITFNDFANATVERVVGGGSNVAVSPNGYVDISSSEAAAGVEFKITPGSGYTYASGFSAGGGSFDGSSGILSFESSALSSDIAVTVAMQQRPQATAAVVGNTAIADGYIQTNAVAGGPTQYVYKGGIPAATFAPQDTNDYEISADSPTPSWGGYITVADGTPLTRALLRGLAGLRTEYIWTDADGLVARLDSAGPAESDYTVSSPAQADTPWTNLDAASGNQPAVAISGSVADLASDPLSDIAKVYLYESDAAAQSGDETGSGALDIGGGATNIGATQTGAVPNPADFAHQYSSAQSIEKVWLKAFDAAGNAGAPKAVTVNIDLDKPTVDGHVSTEHPYAFYIHEDGIPDYTNIDHGVYANVNVTIDVAAADTGGSGVKEITLYYVGDGQGCDDTTKIGTIAVDQDGVAAGFQVPLSLTAENPPVFNKKVIAVAADHAGSSSDATQMTTANSNLKGELMIETVPPDISDAEADPGNPAVDAYTSDDEEWYPDDTTWKFAISDAHSGLYKASVEINGEDIPSLARTWLTARETGLDDPQAIVVSTADYRAVAAQTPTHSGGSPCKGGTYEITVTVSDNAGNTAIKTKTVYIDDDAPAVADFSFSPAPNADASDDVPAAGVQETDYGYFFSAPTEVTVTAQDADPSSGLMSIRYYLAPYGDDGRPTGAMLDESGNAIDEPATKAVADPDKAVDSTIAFTVPAPFKGQVYALPMDYVGNGSQTGAEEFTHPRGSAVETQAQHDAKRGTAQDVWLDIPATPYKDRDGLPLYASAPTIKAHAKDVFAGIGAVRVKVSAQYPQSDKSDADAIVPLYERVVDARSVDGWNVDGTQLNLVAEMSKDIAIGGYLSAPETSGIVLAVEMEDRSGNTTTQEYRFSVDSKGPVVSEISWSPAAAPAGADANFFDGPRTATVTVTDSNWSPTAAPEGLGALCSWSVENGPDPGIVWSAGAMQPDGSVTWTGTAAFTRDANDYLARFVGVKDFAGNAGSRECVETAFTIDTVDPVIEVRYDRTNASAYYPAPGRTATITVQEHNFDAGRVQLAGTATGDTNVFPALSGWSASGDTHTATLTFDRDGEYRFDVQMTDKANRAAAMFTGEKFTVDSTEPASLEIRKLVGGDPANIGELDGTANNDVVIPYITFTETNYESVELKLVGAAEAHNERALTPNEYTSPAGGSFRFTKDFDRTQDVDDLYKLTVTVTDKAGNSSEAQAAFTVNRYGSVYVLDEALEKILGGYVNHAGYEGFGGVRFTEYNVDELKAPDGKDKTGVMVAQNGTARALGADEYERESVNNPSVAPDAWTIVSYAVPKPQFEADAAYDVSVYTEDRAGNVNENIAESKKKEISFTVDRTEPNITVTDFESGGRYREDTKEVLMIVADNIRLDEGSVAVAINGSHVAVAHEEGSDEYRFHVSGVRPEVSITATDAAGNTALYDIGGAVITTNVAIQWFYNTPLFIASIIAIAIIAALLVLAARRRRAGAK